MFDNKNWKTAPVNIRLHSVLIRYLFITDAHVSKLFMTKDNFNV